MKLAAIRVKDGEIVQRAGLAESVSITPDDNGFILHGALGPAPDRWIQSPDDALIGWEQTDDGIRIWTTHPEPTIRFVPDVEQDAESEPLPEPDWGRVLSVADAQEQVMTLRAAERATAIAQLLAVDQVIDDLPDEDIETLTYLYPAWQTGVTLTTSDKVRFDGVLYRVVQGHTTQADWTPPDAPALFTRFRDPDVPQPWTQPQGGHDAYNTGDRVTHDNPNDDGAIWVYESSIDANTTEPGRDGTFDRYWQPIERV